jgi:hypothetical protein
MEDLEEKFKEFQIKLQEEVFEVDPDATITYQRDPLTQGVIVQIDSPTEGLNEFVVAVDPFTGSVTFARLWR